MLILNAQAPKLSKPQLVASSHNEPLAVSKAEDLGSTNDDVRGGLVRVPTTGVDLLSVDLSAAGRMTPVEARRGWAQIGAVKAVQGFNGTLAVGASVGLGALGAAVAGPVGAVVGGLVGLAAGLGVGAWGESFGLEKPIVGLKNLVAKTGAKVGAALSSRLQSIFPKAVKEYQLGPTAHRMRVSDAEADAFLSELEPGDIVLTLGDDNPLFGTIVSLEKKPLDFTHVLLYTGDGQMIEANSKKGRVQTGELRPSLLDHAQIAAVRPHYAPGEAQSVIDQAKTYLGRSYDWLASLSDKRLGCVEVPYHSLKVAAPGHQVPITKVWGLREFIFPSDYLNLTDSKVVASAGVARPMSEMPMARYAPIADEVANHSH